MHLLGKLVGSSLQSVRSNVLSLEKNRQITLKDVEEELINWWMQRDLNRTPRFPGKDQKGRPNHSNGNQQTSPSVDASITSQLPETKSSNGKKGNKTPKSSSSPQRSEEGPTNDDHPEGVPPKYSLCAIAEKLEDFSEEGEANSVTSSISENYIPLRHEMLWDTGATVSLTPLEGRIKEQWNTPPIRINTMGGPVVSKVVGHLDLSEQVSIKNVHVIPKAPYSLFSLSRATARGFTAVFTGEGAWLIPPSKDSELNIRMLTNKAILSAERKGMLWVTQLFKPNSKNNEDFVINHPKPKSKRVIPKRGNSQSSQEDIDSPSAFSNSERKSIESPRVSTRVKDSQNGNRFGHLANPTHTSDDSTHSNDGELYDSEEDAQF